MPPPASAYANLTASFLASLSSTSSSSSSQPQQRSDMLGLTVPLLIPASIYNTQNLTSACRTQSLFLPCFCEPLTLPTTCTDSLMAFPVPTPGTLPQMFPLGLCYIPVLTGSCLSSGAQFRSPAALTIIFCPLISQQRGRAEQELLLTLSSESRGWHIEFQM